ncbi:uncharacterized protein LOC62_05G007516 [Vanrija pseudolonga]|uniref:Uncharacterized protein n=1 Tax=Vanrija pseudolonga TaxID=143232 RepID=A0AAF1BN35_9TREE|nr:hypothetical protein LOC62_05G007516 [Vanrija pseudolonga]
MLGALGLGGSTTPHSHPQPLPHFAGPSNTLPPLNTDLDDGGEYDDPRAWTHRVAKTAADAVTALQMYRGPRYAEYPLRVIRSYVDQKIVRGRKPGEISLKLDNVEAEVPEYARAFNTVRYFRGLGPSGVLDTEWPPVLDDADPLLDVARIMTFPGSERKEARRSTDRDRERARTSSAASFHPPLPRSRTSSIASFAPPPPRSRTSSIASLVIAPRSRTSSASFELKPRLLGLDHGFHRTPAPSARPSPVQQTFAPTNTLFPPPRPFAHTRSQSAHLIPGARQPPWAEHQAPEVLATPTPQRLALPQQQRASVLFPGSSATPPPNGRARRPSAPLPIAIPDSPRLRPLPLPFTPGITPWGTPLATPSHSAPASPTTPRVGGFPFRHDSPRWDQRERGQEWAASAQATAVALAAPAQPRQYYAYQVEMEVDAPPAYSPADALRYSEFLALPPNPAAPLARLSLHIMAARPTAALSLESAHVLTQLAHISTLRILLAALPILDRLNLPTPLATLLALFD